MQDLIQKAKSVLEGNNLGDYTSVSNISDKNRRAFASSISAMGWAHIDINRALDELISLLDYQADNGMIPHLCLVDDNCDHFYPGQNIWNNENHSYFTQAPVWTIALEYCLERGADKKKILGLLDKVEQSHIFFYQERDPLDISLVAISHPWESEYEDSPSWDPSLNRVPTTVKNSSCPDDKKYKRYTYLVESFIDNDFVAIDFSVYDPHISTLLVLSELALDRMSTQLGFQTEAKKRAGLLTESLKKNWDVEKNQASFRDALLDMEYFVPTLGSLSPLLLQKFETDVQDRGVQRLIDSFRTEYGYSSLERSSDQYCADIPSRGAISLTGHWYYSTLFPNDIKKQVETLVRKSGFKSFYHSENGTSLIEEESSLAASLFLVLMN
ncbi:MAG: hypothetical protein EP326_09630 [Deltaproteobacteria bacterium]|nr:MAG: hypothetical protein EP326_09630 [Deltaproteobacteria bacterium]